MVFVDLFQDMAWRNNASLRAATHLLFWSCVAAIWFYLRYQDYASVVQAAAVTAIKVIDLAIIIYTVNGWLVPQLLYRKKYILFALAFVGLVALFSFLKMLAVAQVLNTVLQPQNVKVAVYNNFVTQFFLVLASIALKSAVDYIRLQKRLAEIAKEKAEAELAFLKAQMDPHFLFNSLNAVYFLIDRQNTAARDALHKFSEMLRYQLYECSTGRIPVEKEVGFLRDYVDLQKLRIAENTAVHFSCDDLKDFTIEPLLLMPFVENSFKHLSHYGGEGANRICIQLLHHEKAMIFRVANTTEPSLKKAHSGGIGLDNAKKRLALLYPGKHQLTVQHTASEFSIELQLQLQ